MKRPRREFCFVLSRELGIDVDVIFSWPIGKIAEYMAFFKTQDTEWRKNYIEDNMTPQQRANQILKMLGG